MIRKTILNLTARMAPIVLAAMIQHAHQVDIHIYADMVMNHHQEAGVDTTPLPMEVT
jgi:hypothetical protein